MVQDMTEGQMVLAMTEGQMVQDMTEGQMVQDMTEGQMVQDMTEGQMVQDMTEEKMKPFHTLAFHRVFIIYQLLSPQNSEILNILKLFASNCIKSIKLH